MRHQGGGLYVQSTTLTITNSILRGNVATSYNGGAVSTTSGGTFVNTTIEDNAAGSNGGGVSGSGTFDNVKFIGNYAETGNGGALNAQAASTLTRCVLTDNDAADLGAAIYAIAAVVLSYSVVRGFAGGAGASSIFYLDDVADVSEFNHVRFSNNSLVAIRSAGGSRVVVRNSEGGLAAADVQNVDVLGCADVPTGFCWIDYCSNADIGINCHCYRDGVKTDPYEGSCVSSPQITVPTAEFDILVDKADATGRASVLFSNAGGRPLSFVALVLANGENVAWAISPRAGNLTACEIGNITLAANVLALQPRAAPYLTRFVVNSNSFAAATRDMRSSSACLYRRPRARPTAL